MVRDTSWSWPDSTPGGCNADCLTCTRLRTTLPTLLLQRTWDDLQPAVLAEAVGLTVDSFADHYATIGACARAALDQAAAECLAACSTTGLPNRTDCSAGLVEMLEAVAAWVIAHPATARLLLVIPFQANDPVLLARINVFKRRMIGLFDEASRCSPGTRTYVEFVVGLLMQTIYRQLAEGAEPSALRQQLLAMAQLVATPPPFSGR